LYFEVDIFEIRQKGRERERKREGERGRERQLNISLQTM
jgi:hypothetical protein